jgi:hypothetical protein
VGIPSKNSYMALSIRNYAKYILKEGMMIEKRELLSNLKSKLVLRDKVVQLEKQVKI